LKVTRPGWERPAEQQSESGITRKTAEQSLQFDRHFHYTVTMVRKEFVGVRYFFELEAMRKQGCQVQSLVENHLHQTPHPFLPARAQGRDDAVIAQACGEGLDWHRQFS
jgi:hypothetical protein